jgi:outer membrane protein OmpA-like peptidoglycan-associated protein
VVVAAGLLMLSMVAGSPSSWNRFWSDVLQGLQHKKAEFGFAGAEARFEKFEPAAGTATDLVVPELLDPTPKSSYERLTPNVRALEPAMEGSKTAAQGYSASELKPSNRYSVDRLPRLNGEAEVKSDSIEAPYEFEETGSKAVDALLSSSRENLVPRSAQIEREQAVTLQSNDEALVEKTFQPIDRVVKISFEFDSVAITEESRLVLDRSFDLLGATEDSPISITGYADSLGPKSYNLDLSQKRASAVARYLIDKGIRASRLAVGGGGVYAPDAKKIGIGDSSERELYRFVQIDFGFETR